MIVGLTGAAGSGKDSVADILVMTHGFQRAAFADALYEEVSTAFRVTVGFLQNRETKERAMPILALRNCGDSGFAVMAAWCDQGRAASVSDWFNTVLLQPRSSRQILQWWGTNYRRAQCDTYWTDKVRDRLLSAPDSDWVVTDIRFQNEADLVIEFGGQLVRVDRPNVKPVADHVSEAFWQACSPDLIIRNDGTLEDLMAAVKLNEKRLA